MLAPSAEEATEYLQWSVSALKKHLQAQGVVTTGSKSNLVDRLLALSEPLSPLSPVKKPKETLGNQTGNGVQCKGSEACKARFAGQDQACNKAWPKLLTTLEIFTLLWQRPDLCIAPVQSLQIQLSFVGTWSLLAEGFAQDSSPQAQSLGKALKPSSLSVQQRLAIRLYTAEETAQRFFSESVSVELEDAEPWGRTHRRLLNALKEPLPLYKTLNAPFHDAKRSPTTIANQAPFLKVMAQAVRALAKAGKAFSYTGPAYRGIKVAKSPLLKRKYESCPQVRCVDNTSGSNHLRIAELSAIPSELEILVEPPAVFKVFQPSYPAVLKVTVDGKLDCSVKVQVVGGKAEGNGLPQICVAGKQSTATYLSSSATRGPMTKGSLIIEGFDAVPFCVAHNDQGTTYVQGKGKWRCTSLSAPRWNWREQAPKPTEGRAADLQVIASKSVDNVPQLKVCVRDATEMELKRCLQGQALRDAQEAGDYDMLLAQVTKAKQAGVDREQIEEAEDRLNGLRKLGKHVNCGCDKENPLPHSVFKCVQLISVTPSRMSGEFEVDDAVGQGWVSLLQLATDNWFELRLSWHLRSWMV
ncbi:unnamed protein product [Durusdinium trenchii]|uniref:SAP domain-containing protein n=1 Tax=Durusdinium trenchii TaxID=1381693 RepID=A0ABP0SY20_9DINO